MKPKTAILLVVVLLAVLVAILARQAVRQRRAGEADVTTTDVWTDSIGDVVAVDIESADGKEIRIEQVEDQWQLSKPISAPADEPAVTGVVDPIKSLNYERSYQPGQEDTPSDDLTGLDAPLWKVTLTDTEGDGHVLLVGRPVPLSAGRQTYVRPSGSENIYAVAIDFAAKLDKPASDFRSKQVLNLDKDKIARVEIVGAEKLELVQTDGVWGISKPVSAAAKFTEVDTLVSRLANLSVSEFIDDEPASLRPYGLESGTERLIVRIRTKAAPATTQPETKPAIPEKTYALALGSKTEEKRYAKLLGSPTVFLVRHDLLDDLQIGLADLRDMQVMPVASQQVVKVQLDLPAGKAELVKADDAWRMTFPYEGPANSDAVDRLLSKIDGLQAESMRDNVQVLERFSLSEPVGSIALHQAGKPDAQTLMIGAASPSGEMTFVRRATSNAVAVVKTADLEPIVTGPAAYWATRLVKAPEHSEATAVNIARPDGEFALVKTEGKWRMTAPLAADAEAINVEKVLSRLRDLAAKEMVSLGTDVPARYTEADEKMEVSFTVVEHPPAPAAAQTQPATAPAPVTTDFRVNFARLSGKTYAWILASEPMSVGECYGGLWETLMSELRDRGVWELDAEKVSKVSVSAGPEKLELVRQGDGWKCTADPYVDIDGDKVSKFLSDIRQVKVERFASHDPASQENLKEYGLDKPWFALSVTDAEGGTRELVVSNKGPDKAANRYAIEKQVRGVLVLSSETAAKMAVKLDDFKQ